MKPWLTWLLAALPATLLAGCEEEPPPAASQAFERLGALGRRPAVNGPHGRLPGRHPSGGRMIRPGRRGASDPGRDQTGVTAAPFRAWLDDWTMVSRVSEPERDALDRLTLSAQAGPAGRCLPAGGYRSRTRISI